MHYQDTHAHIEINPLMNPLKSLEMKVRKDPYGIVQNISKLNPEKLY